MNTIYYFGYGANRSPERLKEILGKEPNGGYGAVIENFALCIQSLEYIPDRPKEILEKVWGKDFLSYTIKPGEGLVSGLIWELEEEDFKKLTDWEFVGIWREIVKVRTKTYDNRIVSAVTEKIINDHLVTQVVDGLNYENNLNSQGRNKDYGDEYKIHELAKVRQKLKLLMV